MNWEGLDSKQSTSVETLKTIAKKYSFSGKRAKEWERKNNKRQNVILSRKPWKAFRFHQEN